MKHWGETGVAWAAESCAGVQLAVTEHDCITHHPDAAVASPAGAVQGGSTLQTSHSDWTRADGATARCVGRPPAEQHLRMQDR